jgi:hypothetical protein
MPGTTSRADGGCIGGTPGVPERHVATNVAFAVAEAKGVDVDELQPLEDVVDADALNKLFRRDHRRRGNASGLPTVTFGYAGRRVEIHEGDDGVCIHVSGGDDADAAGTGTGPGRD